MNEWHRNDLERYRSLQELLTLPMFSTEEEADGTIGRFLLRRQLGSYLVCTGYIGQSRDQDPAWTFRDEFSFSHGEMYTLRQRAALQIGLDLIGGME